jgi:hypothetical protein
MEKLQIVTLDIEDYYGSAIENIDFIEPIDIDPLEFNTRVEGFIFSETELTEDGYAVRIQCAHDQPLNGAEELDLIHSQIMDILVEGRDGFLEKEREISDRVLSCLEMLL